MKRREEENENVASRRGRKGVSKCGRHLPRLYLLPCSNCRAHFATEGADVFIDVVREGATSFPTNYDVSADAMSIFLVGNCSCRRC